MQLPAQGVAACSSFRFHHRSLQVTSPLFVGHKQDAFAGGRFSPDWLLAECSSALQSIAKTDKPQAIMAAGAVAGLSAAFGACQVPLLYLFSEHVGVIVPRPEQSSTFTVHYPCPETRPLQLR